MPVNRIPDLIYILKWLLDVNGYQNGDPQRQHFHLVNNEFFHVFVQQTGIVQEDRRMQCQVLFPLKPDDYLVSLGQKNGLKGVPVCSC